MKSLFFCTYLSILLSVFSPAAANLTYADKGSWVKVRPTQSAPDSNNSYGASYLLFDQQLLIENQTQTDYTRTVAKVNNSNGLTELGKISIVFDPSYQTLQVHQVNIIRGAQTINVLDQVEFELIRQESELNQGIYNGKETALLLLEDLQINDILDYDYTINGKNPIFANHVFEVFGLEWGIPVQDLYINVTVPKNKNINYRTYKQGSNPKKIKHKNSVEYIWHLEKVPPLDFQGDYPKWFVARNFLEFTEFNNWQAVANWAVDVFKVEAELDPASMQLVNQWQSKYHDDMSRTAAALNFVQSEIRYFGIEIGVNSHKPRSPAATFATKYGDCKDKTMLLQALLKAMNIQSSPFLVSTELDKGIMERLPSPGLFNHVILQVIIDGKLYWIDPTKTHQGSTLTHIGLPDFAYGLLVDEQTKSLTPINRQTSQITKKLIKETLNINTKQTHLSLQIETINSGDFAEVWRTNLAANSVQQIQNNFESHTNQMYGQAIISNDILVNDDLELNQLSIKEHYELQDPWQENKRYEYMELFAYSLLAYVEMPSRINRNNPLGLAYPLEIKHQFIINDPNEILEFDEQPSHVETSQLNYHKLIKKEGKQIIITHQLQTLSDHTNIDDLTAYFAAIKEIKKQLTVIIGVPIEQKARLKESNERLKSALQQMLKEKK